jgi:benzodiazapine receptor
VGRSAIALVPFLAVVALVALFASRFRPGPWYEELAKAPWSPPNWVFAPAWSLLYLAIAVAGWRVWRSTRELDTALALWAAQLVLNGAWSWLFFGRHQPGLALVDILLLLFVIVAFIATARRVDSTAAWLFVPYAAWVAYASSLNLFVWLRNPASGGV